MSSTSAHRLKYQQILDCHDNIPKTVIKHDLNKTRINALYQLLLSCLRIKRGLKLYEVTHPPTTFSTELEWQSAEGIIYAARPMVLFSQYKSLWLGVYGPVIKSMIYTQLCNKTIQLVDLSHRGLEPRLPRISVDIDTSTSIGKTALQRAIIEVERRFFSNTHDDHLTFSE